MSPPSMLTLYRPNGRRVEFLDDGTGEMVIPAGQTYLKKRRNGKLVMVREKHDKPVSAMGMLGETLGYVPATSIRRVRSRSVESKPSAPSRIRIEDVPHYPPQQIYTPSPTQQSFAIRPPQMIHQATPILQPSFLPSQTGFWSQGPFGPSPNVPMFYAPQQVSHPSYPNAPGFMYSQSRPLPQHRITSQPTVEEISMLKGAMADFNKRSQPEARSKEDSGDKCNTEEIVAKSTVVKTTITFVKHICAHCGTLRSRKFHQENPITPGETPTPAYCRKCQKDASSTSEVSETDSDSGKKSDKAKAKLRGSTLSAKRKVKKKKARRIAKRVDNVSDDESSDSPETDSQVKVEPAKNTDNKEGHKQHRNGAEIVGAKSPDLVPDSKQEKPLKKSKKQRIQEDQATIEKLNKEVREDGFVIVEIEDEVDTEIELARPRKGKQEKPRSKKRQQQEDQTRAEKHNNNVQGQSLSIVEAEDETGFLVEEITEPKKTKQGRPKSKKQQNSEDDQELAEKRNREVRDDGLVIVEEEDSDIDEPMPNYKERHRQRPTVESETDIPEQPAPRERPHRNRTVESNIEMRTDPVRKGRRQKRPIEKEKDKQPSSPSSDQPSEQDNTQLSLRSDRRHRHEQDRRKAPTSQLLSPFFNNLPDHLSEVPVEEPMRKERRGFRQALKQDFFSPLKSKFNTRGSDIAYALDPEPAILVTPQGSWRAKKRENFDDSVGLSSYQSHGSRMHRHVDRSSTQIPEWDASELTPRDGKFNIPQSGSFHDGKFNIPQSLQSPGLGSGFGGSTPTKKGGKHREQSRRNKDYDGVERPSSHNFPSDHRNEMTGQDVLVSEDYDYEIIRSSLGHPVFSNHAEHPSENTAVKEVYTSNLGTISEVEQLRQIHRAEKAEYARRAEEYLGESHLSGSLHNIKLAEDNRYYHDDWESSLSPDKSPEIPKARVSVSRGYRRGAYRDSELQPSELSSGYRKAYEIGHQNTSQPSPHPYDPFLDVSHDNTPYADSLDDSSSSFESHREKKGTRARKAQALSVNSNRSVRSVHSTQSVHSVYSITSMKHPNDLSAFSEETVVHKHCKEHSTLLPDDVLPAHDHPMINKDTIRSLHSHMHEQIEGDETLADRLQDAEESEIEGGHVRRVTFQEPSGEWTAGGDGAADVQILWKDEKGTK